MPLRNFVGGVDFSGAKDAGKHIWISEGSVSPNGVILQKLYSLDSMTDGVVDLQTSLKALVNHISHESKAIIGLDFPFSLPTELIFQNSWIEFLTQFSDEYVTPEKFLERCRNLSKGKELKRRTDIQAKAPWSTYNLRLFRQTWAGIRLVLAPLILQGRARAIPMQQTKNGLPIIAEVCPASFLKRAQIYFPYKGRGLGPQKARSKLLNSLVNGQFLTPPGSALRRTIINDVKGDALDAVLASLGAARIENPFPVDDIDCQEGRIYF